MFENIKSLVEFAYENVPLYRWLYGEKPELRNMGDFERLPCLTKNDFALCGIEDILSDPDEAIAILPPIEDKTIFPFPRLESAEDRDSRYEVFYFLLRQAGIPDGSSFLIITDSSHSYYCGEIANNLLYYGHPTWMMLLRDHSAHEVKEWIDRFQPDCLFLGLKWIPDWVLNCGITRIFTINSYDRDISDARRRHFDIYAITEVGWIGIRIPGGNYVYPREYFHVESDPRDNILTLTTLATWLQPFIKYKTSDRGKTLGDNILQLTYIGEH